MIALTSGSEFYQHTSEPPIEFIESYCTAKCKQNAENYKQIAIVNKLKLNCKQTEIDKLKLNCKQIDIELKQIVVKL